jgi:tetratricopeptide (TPR) repeat protein
MAPQANRIDELANRYQADPDEIVRQLDALPLVSLEPHEREAWYHLRGVMETRRGQASKAVAYFEQGLAEFPNSGWLNFGLGQEHERAGRVESMLECFRKVRLEDAGARAVLAVSRYLYLWDRIVDADAAIQPLFDVIYKLGPPSPRGIRVIRLGRRPGLDQRSPARL